MQPLLKLTPQLTERITILRFAAYPDDYGSFREEWVVDRQCWAQAEWLGIRDVVRPTTTDYNDLNPRKPTARYRFVVRQPGCQTDAKTGNNAHFPDIMRIIWLQRTYKLHSPVIDLGQHYAFFIASIL